MAEQLSCPTLTMNYTTRPALPSDAEACVSILRNWIFDTDWMPKQLNDVETMVQWWAEHFQNEHAWVAENEGRVVGFCSRQRGSNNISALYVTPDAQNGGLGKQLLDLAKQNCNRIVVWAFEANENARRFYHREGLIEIDREMDEDLNIMDVEHRWTKHGVPVESVISSLNEQFPDTDITIVKRFGGFQQDMAELTFTTPKETKTTYLKCYVSHLSWWTANSQSIYEREKNTIALFKQHDLLVPTILASGETKGINWLLLDKMDGTELNVEPLNFDPEQLGQTVAKMHAIELSAHDACEFAVCDIEYIDTRLRSMAEQTDCPPAAIDRLKALAVKFHESSELVFCHGDLHRNNIFVNDSGSFTVFDFEESVISYRQFDVAALASNLQRNAGKETATRFIQAYVSASNTQFTEDFIEDCKEFDALRTEIVGIYTNSVATDSGFTVCESFIQDNNTAIAFIHRVLLARPVKDALRAFLGDDFDLIKRIKFDVETGKFAMADAPEAVLTKMREANFLNS